MKKHLGTVLFVLVCQHSIAQQFSKTKTGLKTEVNGINIELQVYSPEIVRVIKHPKGTDLKKTSLSVIMQPATPPFEIKDRSHIVTLSTTQLTTSLDLNTGRLIFYKAGGSALLTEKDTGVQFSPTKDVTRNTYDVRQSFLLDSAEMIYGLGQQQNGHLNQRYQQNLLIQQNMKVSIPFFQSSKGYGIFWDNYAPTLFTDNKKETSFDSKIGDGIDYYFMAGDSGDSIVAQMRKLTGQAPMMPLWVYGYSQSRERYKTQFELVDVVKKYRALHVPLDGIIQDWQYWGEDSNWNAMGFDPLSFPRPQKMIDSVHQMNAHLFIVSWPGFGPKTKQYAELKKKKLLLGFDTWPPKSGAKPYDVYNPEARDIFWRYLNAGIFSIGADGWWLDSSEPDHVNEKDSDFDLPTFLGSYRSVRNAFPLEHIQGVYEHQRKTSTKKRVSILTRSAFAGQQRYAANTWSGDITSDWETFKKQIPAGLNFSMTGIPYWNTDIGGFFAGDFLKAGGAKNPEFQELYTRWLQFGTFMPMMRSHGTAIPREIYQFGKKGDQIYDVIDKFIHLRYSLLPYLYATAWDVTARSGSIMRALIMDFKADKQVWNIGNEYMFGKSFLVAPVTVKGAKEQNIYLPIGANWYDFWTGEIVKGGQTVDKKTPIAIMPLYVRAGSIIPWGPKVQYATEKKWDNLEIRIYTGADADFTLYEDENDNYDYEKGLFSQIHFHWDDKDKQLTIGARKGRFPEMLESRNFNILLVGRHNGAGPELSGRYDKKISYSGDKKILPLF